MSDPADFVVSTLDAICKIVRDMEPDLARCLADDIARVAADIRYYHRRCLTCDHYSNGGCHARLPEWVDQDSGHKMRPEGGNKCEAWEAREDQ